MPIEISVPFPDPQQNVKLGWPNVRGNLNTGGAFDTSMLAPDYGGAVGWQASVGAGANTMQIRDEITCALFAQTVQRTFTPYALIKPLVTNLAPGFRNAEQQRVYRLTVQMAMGGAGQLGPGSGIQFSPASALLPSYTEIGQPAFGIVGDGAGGWQYLASNLAGAFPGNVNSQVAIGAGIIPDATEWNTFEFEFINSAPARAATFSVRANGVLIASRNWSVGEILPLLQAVANGTKFLWAPRNNTVGSDLFVGPLTVELGRFTGAGLEIFA